MFCSIAAAAVASFLALFSQFDFTVAFFTERNSYHHLLRDKRRTVLTSPLPFSQVSLAATNCKNEHEESPTISPYSSPWLEHDFDKNGSSGSLSVSQHFITISYEGASCQIPIASSSSSPGETILAALERHQLYLQRQLGLPELSSDCRRGNCLTCAARVITDRPQNGEAQARYAEKDDNDGKDSAIPRVIRSANGLSPYMAKQVQDAGYILTCSSFVTGSGLELQLSQQDLLWKLMYQQLFESEETQYVARQAKARWLRKLAEKNLSQWKQATEQAWQQTTKLTEEQGLDDK